MNTHNIGSFFSRNIFGENANHGIFTICNKKVARSKTQLEKCV